MKRISKRDHREAMLIVGSSLLGAVMAKALDLVWLKSLWPAMLTLGIACILVYFLALWILSFLPK